MSKAIAEPTHEYIGRKRACGCVVAVTADFGDKHTADRVAEFIRGGLVVEHISRERLDDYFPLGCKHQTIQLEMAMEGGE